MISAAMHRFTRQFCRKTSFAIGNSVPRSGGEIHSSVIALLEFAGAWGLRGPRARNATNDTRSPSPSPSRRPVRAPAWCLTRSEDKLRALVTKGVSDNRAEIGAEGSRAGFDRRDATEAAAMIRILDSADDACYGERAADFHPLRPQANPACRTTPAGSPQPNIALRLVAVRRRSSLAP